jgi:diguanylate cyclase (GGDEF)-like protein
VAVGLRGVTAVPLMARGRTWGVLDLYRTAVRHLDAGELAAARTLAHLATSYLVVAEDRDGAHAAREELAHRAMHDPLTDLPVRWVYLEQLAHALARLERHPGAVAVLFVDLDGLKYVNDTWGHRAGDELILACVQRIRAALRPTDTVARLGGDEFLVLLEEVDLAAACAVAERVLAELAQPYQPDGHVIQPSASIGIALTGDPEQTPDALIAHADSAMYRAKQAGRARYELFDPATYAADRALANQRESLTATLRRAVRQGELVLHYQPIVDLDAVGDAEAGEGWLAPGALYGVEALLRWQGPDGLRLPQEFLPAAERAGLMGELGGWVLDTACRQLAAWDAQLGERSPARLFLNAGVQELSRPDLPEHLRRCVTEVGLAPSRVTVEVTETGLFTDSHAVRTCLSALVGLGCELALDDFGTGYSSLSRLLELPAATIKVDSSFTRTLADSRAATAVVSSVLLLGRDLGRPVVVEGVETPGHLRALRELGCRYAQGFLLGRPLPGEEVAALLGADLRLPHAG